MAWKLPEAVAQEPAAAVAQEPAAVAQENPSDDASPAAAVPSPAVPDPAMPIMPPAEPRPLSEQDQELVAQYDQRKQAWAETLTQMRTIQIRYNNGVDRSPESMQQHAELRDRARVELRELFAAAERLFAAREDHYDAASMLVTTLDYRREKSIYEGSYSAAKMMLDAGVKMPFLYLMAARSAFVEGHFDEVTPLYESLVETLSPEELEKIEKIDQQIVNILDFYPAMWEEELKQREADAEAGDLPQVLLETTRGPVRIELFEDQAPNTVANFIQLVEEGFYDETEFYQVLSDLLAMGGDPRGDGSGTSGRFIPDEHDRPGSRRIFRGSLFMAKRPEPGETGSFVPDSASSQFVIAMMPILPKERTQTVFGRVIEGMDVVGSFQRIDPEEKKDQQVQLPPDRILTARVIRKRDHDYTVEYTR